MIRGHLPTMAALRILALPGIARVEVGRALLAEAMAHGSLTTFANLVRSPDGVR